MADGTKRKYTPEERAALASKLDDDLDKFIENLAANKKKDDKPKEPFDFDKFMKELDEHPMFMKDLNHNEDGQYSEYIEALQAMKYDDDAAVEASEKAEEAKKEGNKFFGLKKYRWAVDAYSNGIKALCMDRELNSQLYGNRAAAQRHLGNLASAAKDCIFAFKYNPRNLKAVLRGAECLLDLGYARRCLSFIERATKDLAEIESEDSKIEEARQKQFDHDLEEVRKKAVARRVVEERDERRRLAQEKKLEQEKLSLLSAFKARRYHFKPWIEFDKPAEFDFSDITIRSPYTTELLQERVYIDKETGGLMWPVLLQYVGAGHTDMIKDAHEDLTIKELLSPAFDQPASWDQAEWKYRSDNVRLFIPLDIFNDSQLYEVSPKVSLRHLLATNNYTIFQGLPVIQVYLKETAESELVPLGQKLFRPK